MPRATDLHYRLLGPVEVRAGGQVVPLSRQLRAVLAVLLLHANQAVTAPYLIDQVWGSEPPTDPRRALQVSISRLRRAFGADGDLIQTTPGGYRSMVAKDQLDVARFRGLVAQAGATGDMPRRAGLLDQALALWAGEPLSDLAPEARVREHASSLYDERLRAIEQLGDTRLELGQHNALLPQLTALTAQHPLRQRLWHQLITALWRSDRPAEALAAYAEVSRSLHEAGTAPSDAIRQLHREVLAYRAPLDDVSGSGRLPTDRANLVVHAEAVSDAITRLGRSRGPTITAYSGPAGAGKTTLAVHLAHRLRARFPDGQWFFDLRGTGPDPRTPDEVLDQLLRLCGTVPAGLPVDLDAKAAELRSRLAGRKVLIVLDDAVDTRQVMPLLPGAAGSAVIVTSRQPLPGLVVHFGATNRHLPRHSAGGHAP